MGGGGGRREVVRGRNHRGREGEGKYEGEEGTHRGVQQNRGDAGEVDSDADGGGGR